VNIPSPPQQHPSFVVGVGASAGGIEPLRQLLQNLPADTGAAFVLVQHLDPRHASALPSLLSHSTVMPVAEAQDGVPMQADHVYVIPSSMDLALADGHLKLLPRSATHGLHLPINAFFLTLANVQGAKAIGVILSGTASDGTLGLQAIKAAGGLCFAQDPKSAKYDGMPRSAIASGCVDAVLTPEEIAREIARVAGGSLLKRPVDAAADARLPDDEADGLEKIFLLLQEATGSGLGSYKKPTLLRRIRRRMGLVKIQRIQDYAKHLAGHPAEVQSLYQDLLIGVTSFFRDPPTVEALIRDVFPVLIQNRPADAPLRLWVPGCSTGEEAYTLAICLLELLNSTSTNPSVQIFGTDVSENAVTKARAGLYPESIAGHVSPERLERFFTRIDGKYQISKAVRTCCVFARHDLIQDPPFSHLDLISCRNVLIYLTSVAQKRVMAGFHYALKPAGFLVLGSSESPASSLDLFHAVHRDHKIYTPVATVTRSIFGFGGSAFPQPERRFGTPSVAAPDLGSRVDVQREADRVLLSRYGPVGVLIDENLEILQFRGDTTRYLEHPQGTASLSLTAMVRKGLLAGLSRAIAEAKATNKAVRSLGLTPQRGRQRFRGVEIEVIPVQGLPDQPRCFLVLFEEPAAAGKPRKPGPKPAAAPRRLDARDQHIAQLDEELATTRHHLQSVIEDQQAANQDLQAGHEESLSRNEELQSLNEELETAKEELQSGNEELTTLNEELHQRNLDLVHLSDDLVNLLGSLHIPVVLLGPDLRLRRFTPGAAKLFNLLPSDRDRLLSDLRANFDVPDLGKLILESIATASLVQREVQDGSGCWYSLRIRPYKTSDNRIDGAVMVLVGIDALKRSAEESAKARDFADAIVQTIQQPLLVLNENLKVEKANRAFHDFFRIAPREAEGRSLKELGDGPWNLSTLPALLETILREGTELNGLEVEHDVPGIGGKTIALSARRMRQGGPGPAKVLLALEDRTEIKKAEVANAALLAREQAVARQAEQASQLKDEFVATVSHELRGPLSAMSGWMYVLDRSQGDPEITARGLAAISRNIQVQTKLVDDLLDVARIMTGKLHLSVRLMKLEPVVEAALQAVRSAADAKGIALQLSSEGTVPDVLGDADRMQQIAWNLLSNAVKFTPSGGRIDVRLGRAGNGVELQVRDTGMGISPEFQPYVFERFRQAEASQSRKYLGLGLGLAIVKDLAELQGGTVKVESTGKDQGSTFTVTFPVPALLIEEPAAEEESKLPAGQASLAGLRLLVVEDEDSSREMLVALLEQYGADVASAASAREAYAALEAAVPDVLISDIGMPGESGYELLRKVRVLPPERGGQVPAIAFTAFSSEQDRQEVLAAGFQMHHTKPTDPARLVAAIAALGRRPRSG
jgi:two-component system CheB/CheR fusion protein